MMGFASSSRRARQAGQPGSMPQLRPGQEAAAIVRLQRALGNRGTRALLRSPHGTEPEFAALASASLKGGLDAATWSQKVTAAKQALREHKLDDATGLYIELYQDLARTAGADAIADVSPNYSINVAAGDDTSYKAGLNLVLGTGGSKGGSTAYVDSAGKFGVKLSLSGGATQAVAIRLFGGSFKEDKA